MGNRRCGRPRKFYWEQVEQIQGLFVRYINQRNATIDIEKYYRICEQLGEEPDPEKMPLSHSEFPIEVQVAFFVFDLLSDVWEGMSGTYMGKDWGHCSQLFDLWEVDDQKTVMYFMKMYERQLVNYRADRADEKRSADKRKAKASGGGKNYTHNIQG